MSEPTATSPSPAADADRSRRARKIPVRAMGFPFDRSIRRFWLFGNPHATHIANGINLLFPDGERFFIRSVKHYLEQVSDDPELVERIRGFFGQEGRHGHEHERLNRILEAQGYDLEGFLGWYRHLAYEVIEPAAPPALRLSVTAAAEHLTASLAHRGLTRGMLDHAPTAIADLLRWHAAEEIEHKSVAFDVFQKVDGRYGVRAVGMFVALGLLLFFWQKATQDLLAQEARRGTDLRGYGEAARLNPMFAADREERAELFRRAVLDYLRPDFHPDQIDDTSLARGLLASLGRANG
jgi:predicted metal-dependent hydrolase